MSPLGLVIYDYLNDTSFTWSINKYNLWIEDRNFSLDKYRYVSEKIPDEITSPCILWICSGKSYLEDKRIDGLSDYDKELLWPIIQQKIDKLTKNNLFNYIDLRNKMIIDKLKGTR